MHPTMDITNNSTLIYFKYTFPHRKGGKDHAGARGNISEFYFSSILKNTFNIFESLQNRPHERSNFSTLCYHLATGLTDTLIN